MKNDGYPIRLSLAEILTPLFSSCETHTLKALTCQRVPAHVRENQNMRSNLADHTTDLKGPKYMTNELPRNRKIIQVSDKFQWDYSYALSADYGDMNHGGFEPKYTPNEMLKLGVFEGKYINDCAGDFPAYWYDGAKFSDRPDPEINFFGTKSRQSLEVWQSKGWILGRDPRGWFQWYCRFFMGRRIAEIDPIQVKRWKSFSRHRGQIVANCEPGDLFCRPRQRQALLQWSHDPML